VAKAKRRGNNEGSITRRKDGRYLARITIGRDPMTGKLNRVSFYGKTRQEVADKLNQALSDRSRGTLVAPHKSQWANGSIRGLETTSDPLCGQSPTTLMKCLCVSISSLIWATSH
jgi:hypothetical protein